MARKKTKTKNGIFAAVGAATGLGNAFRFPALCLNYGAAFIIAYAVALAAVCYPLLVAELNFGRRKTDPKSAKIWTYILRAAAANSTLIALYYGVIAAKLGSAGISFALFCSPQTNSPFLFTAALFAVLGAAYALIKGAPRTLSVSGKVSVLLSFALFCTLAAAGLVQGGAFSSFDFARLEGYEIWLDALGQALLALSLAAGVMPTYAKSLPQGSSTAVAALEIVVANFAFCMLAMLSILPFSVTFSRTVGVTSGINAYSQVIFALFSGGTVARVFGFLLFAVLTVVAVHSLSSLALPAVTLAAGKVKRASLVFCIISACLAPLFVLDGMTYLAVCDKIACSYNAVIIAAAEAAFFLSRRHITGAIAAKGGVQTQKCAFDKNKFKY